MELESKFSRVTQSNLELQRAERELRDQLVSSVTQADYDGVRGRLEVAERAAREAHLEADRLREVGDVARNQVTKIHCSPLISTPSGQNKTVVISRVPLNPDQIPRKKTPFFPD